jgi:hypothetical protein
VGVWASAVALRVRSGTPVGPAGFTLLLCHFLFFVLLLKARRFMEYWPIYCVLSAATLAQEPLNGLIGRLDRKWAAFRSERWAEPGKGWLAGAVPRALGLALWLGIAASVVHWTPMWKGIRDGAACELGLPAIRAAMAALRAASRPGDVVFTDDWDIFPVFFYYNTYNHYIVGLDPKFTHHRDPVLWERYVKISRGQVPAQVTVTAATADGGSARQNVDVRLEDIRNHFGARFVITDRDHKALAAKLAKAPDLAELIYPSRDYDAARDAPYLIFRVRPFDSEN